MKSVEPESHNEIIIVRRGDEDADEGGSGVWEIAYADFMTSMMAFFLVMWLVNAANEETKAAVASYFNPIKLVDRNSNPRGIQSNNEVTDQDSRSKDDTSSSKAEEKQLDVEQQKMMSEPYEELDKISKSTRSPNSNKEVGKGGSTQGGTQKGASRGTAYRDPFSPDYWTKNASPIIEATDGGPSQHSGGRDPNLPTQPDAAFAKIIQGFSGTHNEVTPSQADQQRTQQELVQSGKESKLGNDVSAMVEQKSDTNGGKAAIDAQGAKNGQSSEQVVVYSKPETPQEAANNTSLPAIVREISSELSELVDEDKDIDQPMVRVISINDGIAIELMDKANYGMFAIGSAKPDKKAIDLIEGIAKILQTKKGDVVVSGHTDSRPYKTATYDNWQLSSSRAQMAYYMLVRGGLDEKRILRVEGYADHRLKNKEDPYAAENRRIEIFMRLTGDETDQKSGQSRNVDQKSGQSDNVGKEQ